MNKRMVISTLGKLLKLVAYGMVLPLLVSLYYGEGDSIAFLLSILISFAAGLVMSKIEVFDDKLRIKDGLSIVTFGWLLASAFGALPFYISGAIPSYIDCFFETVSGFTTTGATIVTNIEALPHGILFWRSFTHWIGGMGILVVAVALIPTLGAGGFHVFRAESPGPISERITPHIKDTAMVLYITYGVISLIEFVLLLIGGMSPFESAVHTFGTLGTGGFSSKNASIGAYDSSYIQTVITVFMILAGTNFALYYQLYRGRVKEVFKNSELRLYLGILATAIILITIDIFSNMGLTLGKSLQDAAFQVSSIVTTTGYATTDFDLWPTFSKNILFVLMFVGGSSGSTGGSIKIIRLLVLFKVMARETKKVFHPRAVIAVKVDEKPVKPDVISNIVSFIVLYMLIFAVGTVIVSLEGISMISASSAVAATLGNIGPGFEFVGATQTYALFSPATKLLLSFFMLIGRLELFTVIALLTPSYWKSEH